MSSWKFIANSSSSNNSRKTMTRNSNFNCIKVLYKSPNPVEQQIFQRPALFPYFPLSSSHTKNDSGRRVSRVVSTSWMSDGFLGNENSEDALLFHKQCGVEWKVVVESPFARLFSVVPLSYYRYAEQSTIQCVDFISIHTSAPSTSLQILHQPVVK